LWQTVYIFYFILILYFNTMGCPLPRFSWNSCCTVSLWSHFYQMCDEFIIPDPPITLQPLLILQSMQIECWITFCFEAINHINRHQNWYVLLLHQFLLIPNQRILGTPQHIAFPFFDQFYKNPISVCWFIPFKTFQWQSEPKRNQTYVPVDHLYVLQDA
jgi:hypothetical protein